MDPDLLIRRRPMTNLVILTGRIARDPETRTTQGGTSITSISVVTDRPARNKEGKTYKDESGYTAKDSEFHRVTCFNGLGKNVAQYCTKGQLVSVQGRTGLNGLWLALGVGLGRLGTGKHIGRASEKQNAAKASKEHLLLLADASVQPCDLRCGR
jgi:hypothetical protein